MRGDHVEPGVAEERRPSDGCDQRQEPRAKRKREHRPSERQRQEQIEPDPGDVPMIRDVPLGERRAEVDRPREEPDHDRAEQHHEPEPVTPREVHLANCAERR